MNSECVVNEAPERLLSRKEAALYLGVSMPTLAIWGRTRAHELPFIKMGRLVKYRRQDVDSFVARNTVTGSLEHAASVPIDLPTPASESPLSGEGIAPTVTEMIEAIA